MCQTWSLIIFTYNESPSLGPLIESCHDIIVRLNRTAHEIIVVDDGSTDDTAAVVRKYLKIYECLKYVKHPRNLGIGRALYTGYRHAVYENVCALPGDGQFKPDELLPYRNFAADTFVSFFRRHKRYSAYRQALTYSARLLNRCILGLDMKDVNWVKIYKKDHIRRAGPALRSVAIESELCAFLCRKGVRPVEVPSDCCPRVYGKSHGGSPITVLKAAADMWRLLIKRLTGS